MCTFVWAILHGSVVLCTSLLAVGKSVKAIILSSSSLPSSICCLITSNSNDLSSFVVFLKTAQCGTSVEQSLKC